MTRVIGDREAFLDPPIAYRPAPFWGLNSRLEDGELRRQIRAMRDGGCGGFFMHPRDGLRTPYLSRAWFDAVRTCVDEAGRVGMSAWIYDDNPFPTGIAGGEVPALHPDRRMKALVCRLHDRSHPIHERVALFEADVRGGQVTGARPAEAASAQEADWERRLFLHFYMWTSPLGEPSSRGWCFIDGLDPDAVDAFLQTTYEAYRAHVGGAFGGVVPGAMSDIPVYAWHFARPVQVPSMAPELAPGVKERMVPWTPRLPALFRARYGYDLVPHLPSLFFDVGDYAAVRTDFWRLVADRFRDVFIRRLHDWCARNGLRYAAHLWGEEKLHWQVQWTGSAMDCMAFMHLPGTDHVLRDVANPIGIKHLDSVACQLGRERALVESYALSGQNLSLEEQKWIGDWAHVLGANMLVPYIAAYSLEGMRKRDEPPCLGPQQPWFRQNRVLADYFARLGVALTSGRRVVDVLVLEPLASMRVLYAPSWARPAGVEPREDPFGAAGYRCHAFDETYAALVDDLLRHHIDFHLGDEEILARHARLEDGSLRVGEAAYAVVVVPPSLSWSRGTLDLLRRFAEAGGRVVAVEPLPTMADGRPADPAVLPEQTVVADGIDALLTALDEALPTRVRIDDGPNVWLHHRRDEAGEVLFLANTSRAEGAEIRVTLPGAGAVEEWDLFTGAARSVEGLVATPEAARVTVDMPPVSSRLLVRHAAAAGPGVNRGEGERRRVDLAARWRHQRLDPNALTLDFCRLAIDDGPLTPRVPVWRAQDTIQAAGFGVPFEVVYRFEVQDVPGGDVHVVLERPERWEVTLNGEPVARSDAGSYWDHSFRKIRLPSLSVGANEIRCRGTSGIDTELESVYLVGDFAVRRDDLSIARERDSVDAGDLVEQGYPFFVGSMRLYQDVELPPVARRARLTLEGLNAAVAEVTVNGRAAGTLFLKPYELDVTGLTQPGRNRIEVVLTNTLHNLLGPHHNRTGEAVRLVHRHSFRDTEHWTDGYYFAPFGLDRAAVYWA